MPPKESLERDMQHCGNHEANTKDISSMKGWIKGICVVGAVLAFFGNRYMNAIESQLTKISSTTEQSNTMLNAQAVQQATVFAEMKELRRDVDSIQIRLDRHDRQDNALRSR